MSVQQATMPRPMPSLDYGVGAGLGLLVAGMIGFGLAQAGSVPMQLDVYGELGRINPASVQALAAPLLGDGFFQLDAEALEQRIQSLAWVRDAQVERLWPDRVAVHLQGHEPLAAWGGRGVLTLSGALIYPEKRPDVALQVEAGEGQVAAVFADLEVVLPSLPASWVLSRWQVSTTGDRQAQILLDGQQITLEFGREPVREKFELLAKVALPVLQPRLKEVAAVDLRYRNGFAVRWLTGGVNREGEDG